MAAYFPLSDWFVLAEKDSCYLCCPMVNLPVSTQTLGFGWTMILSSVSTILTSILSIKSTMFLKEFRIGDSNVRNWSRNSYIIKSAKLIWVNQEWNKLCRSALARVTYRKQYNAEISFAYWERWKRGTGNEVDSVRNTKALSESCVSISRYIFRLNYSRLYEFSH